jgi:hypothetical protein
MYSVWTVFLNWDLKSALYFVLETRSTALEAIFHVLRQDTTVQSTVDLKQSLNIFDLTLFYFILFYIPYFKKHYALYLILNRDHNSGQITDLHIHIYKFYTADFQDDPPISKRIVTLQITRTSLVLTEFHFSC